MRVISKAKENPSLIQVTCVHCKAVLEITPEDCTNSDCVAFGKEFAVECPECNCTNWYDRNSVPFEFWRRIPTPNEM